MVSVGLCSGGSGDGVRSVGSCCRLFPAGAEGDASGVEPNPSGMKADDENINSESCAACDFQFTGCGVPSMDLAYFLFPGKLKKEICFLIFDYKEHK